MSPTLPKNIRLLATLTLQPWKKLKSLNKLHQAFLPDAFLESWSQLVTTNTKVESVIHELLRFATYSLRQSSAFVTGKVPARTQLIARVFPSQHFVGCLKPTNHENSPGCFLLTLMQGCLVVISKKGQINLSKKPKSTIKAKYEIKTQRHLKHPNALSQGNIYIFYT